MASCFGGVFSLSDDLLVEILIRLPTLSDLGRACIVCVVFRRVITGHSFLRRVYAIHPPSLLGFRTLTGKFQPVEPSDPSSAAAYAIARVADFRFSFLPNSGFWVVRDARDSLFVLDYNEHGHGIFNNIVVCDPLIPRYVLLPPIPQNLASTVLDPYCTIDERSRKCDVFLAPCGEVASMMGVPKSFRVIWMAQCPTKLVTFIFCYTKWQWQAIAIPDWLDVSHVRISFGTHLHWCSYAYGCFYWLWDSYNKLVVIDMSKMEFSYVSHLSFAHVKELAVVELGEGRRGIFVLNYSASTCSTILRLFAESQNGGEGATEWLLENEVSLGKDLCGYRILGDAGGKLILQRRSFKRPLSSGPEFSYISLDFKTFQFQRIPGMLRRGYTLPFLYIGYPSSLSLPTI